MALKKALKKIYITAFLAACTVPSVAMLFGKSDASATENRTLSSFPKLVSEDNKINPEWTSEFETYISEHFGLRNAFVTANALIKSELFGVSAENSIIVGKNDWLFFAQTLDDYMGRNTLTQVQIDSIVHNLKLVDEYVQSLGGSFLFTVAPNKNTLYPQNMPSYYIAGENSNLNMLCAAFADSSVNYADMVKLFGSQEKVMYHKWDSHWNNEGAILAYNALLDGIQKEHDDYSGVQTSVEKVWEGDLYGMLYPNLKGKDEQVIYPNDFKYQYTGRFRTEEDINISTENPNAQGRLLMFRDSFGNALLPFMAEAFAKADFSRAVPYRLDNMQADTDTTVIMEVVERNIPLLYQNAPVMPAPSADAPQATSSDTSSLNTLFTSDNGSFIKLYGCLDEKYFNKLPRIYVTLSNDEYTGTYEAFCALELSSLKENASSDYGYSLYIDKSMLANGSYSVSIALDYLSIGTIGNINVLQ